MELLKKGELYKVHFGDAITHMANMPAQSAAMSVYSPPFPAIFSYTDKSADIGNSEDLKGDGWMHLSFFFRQFVRIMMPGRVVMVHAMQIGSLGRKGHKGTIDFRGILIRLAQRAGLIYEYDWLIRKNPQALKNGSRVLTPRGWVEIQNLVIGSEVIGSAGTPIKVVGVWPQGVRLLYRVKFNDGTYVDCDGQHKWSVHTLAERSKANPEVIVKTTDELFSQGVLTEGGENRYSVPLLQGPAALTRSKLPLDPYLLGVLLGDGLLSRRSVVGVCCEGEIVESLTLPSGHRAKKLPGTEVGNNVASYAILSDTWHDNKVISAIRDLGLFGKRAWEKHIPKRYLFADADSRLALLQGLMDTDGSLNTKGGVRFSTTSKRLAEGVKFLVESLGGLCSIIEKPGNHYVHKGERRQGRNIWYVAPRLMGNIPPFRMVRKLNKWRPLARTIHRRIVSIEPVGRDECTCITVDASDGLFATEGCVLTHNSVAIRTHNHKLLFVTLERDRVASCGVFGDYLIKFRAPGDNLVPINSSEISREDWIDWAEPAWNDIRETDTLNKKEGREATDTKHIAPLQLGLIERCIKLYSNPGEIIFDPFSGLASTGHEAIRLGRRYYGCELKKKYWEAGMKNLKRAETASGKSRGFFHNKPSSNGDNGSTGNRDKPSGRRVQLIED